MSGFERSLRTTATTLNVVQGPLGPIAGRVGALAAAVGELTGFRLGLAGTGAALFALTSQANRYTEIRSRLVPPRSEEHTSALQSLMRTSYAVVCFQKKTRHK